MSSHSKTIYRQLTSPDSISKCLISRLLKVFDLNNGFYQQKAFLTTGNQPPPGPEEPTKKNDRFISRERRQKLINETKTKTNAARAAVKKAINNLPIAKNKAFRENLYTLPNMLTFSRLLSAPLIGYLVLKNQHFWAVSLFSYASFTDLIDGYIARKYNLQSVAGSVLDPMADKILMISLTGCLAWTGGLPLWLAVIIFGRDFLLGLSAIYYRYISLPPPRTFQRYWDFTIPSAEVHPTTISKYNTALQMALIAVSVIKPLALQAMAPDTQIIALNAISALEYTVATTTILSGLSYVTSKTAVKILTPEEIERKRIEQEERDNKAKENENSRD
ncbi:CDP-alcohol phosphatidyltransferase-domain-containing protein [Lipomyces japonicus]|uniref:CDP-alcohol phosphatidyltransferase-domain-containing protein n=1 Tax=Lipomyces japonicus TaxID=56871 RepID=UPI0034CDB69E